MLILREYQDRIAREAAEKVKQYGLCYLSMQCRTGKTITALEAARLYGAQRVLWVTKKKAIPSIWADYKGLERPFILEVINYESVHKITQYKADFAVIDEAHSIGAFPKPGKHQKDLKAIVYNLPCLFLSATPTPESYSQLYHQLNICRKSPWGGIHNFYAWVRAGYVKPKTVYHPLPTNDYSDANLELIKKDVAHLFISYTQEEAGFSSEIKESVAVVDMDVRVREMQRSLELHGVADIPLADGTTKQIIADKPAVLMQKLHQLCGGTIIADKESYIVDYSKAYAIRQRFEGQRIAIFYVFQKEKDLLKHVFPEATEKPEEFQSGDKAVFIGQVRRFREGVRLDKADALIYYNTEFSYLSYEQGRNRLLSKERTEPAKVWFFCTRTGIDTKVLKAVHEKKDFTYSYYKRNRTL